MAETATDPRRFLTLKQASEVSGLSAKTLERAVHAGELRAKRSAKTKEGDGRGKILVRVADLDAWFDGLVDA